MKRIITVLAALAFAPGAYAQLGVIGGFTSSKTDIESAIADVKNVSLYHAGLAYKFEFGSLLAVQPSIVYNVKGTKIADLMGVEDFNADYNTGYVEVPVMVSAGVDLTPSIRAFVFGEPYVGYAVTNKIQFNGENTETWDNIKNKLEYGVGAGFGVELSKQLQLSVRYFWDMGTVYGDEITFESEVINIQKTLQESKCSGIKASLAIFF